jgi:plasmid stabilization system protein ParE
LVRKRKLPIRWDRLAKKHLDNIYEYIAQDSVTAAKRVKKELILLAHSLNDFPEKYLIEEYLAHEPENYRSVTKWSYKIIYEVTDECIIIADVFQTSNHTSRMLADFDE